MFKSEYQQLTGIKLTDSFIDKKKLYHYELLRERYTFEQLRDMNYIGKMWMYERKDNDYYRHYSISDMNESVIVAHLKQINERNGFPSYERQFKKQAKKIIDKYELGAVRHALHRAENMKLDNEISFTFIERLLTEN